MTSKGKTMLLDCTLRDGGYYNAWDFSSDLIADYLVAMKAAEVDIVELGFRFMRNSGFKGPCAFTTDDFLQGLNIPSNLKVGVMVNGADLCSSGGWEKVLDHLFPVPAESSPVDLVRLACHFHELDTAFHAAAWLHDHGYRVGINLMQISDRSRAEITELAKSAADCPLTVLYFADSMGSMSPEDAARIVGWLREGWQGELGIHTHDNMGLALSNTLRAHSEGVTWLDSTVTGMGRGPGNARTEELAIEAERLRGRKADLVPLMGLIRRQFEPLKSHYGWGTNPYYFLAGKYGIHPTYIQEMLGDARYDDEDILAVIEHLREEGGKKFSFNTLDGARQFYRGEPRGNWAPREMIAGRDVLILGTGPGAGRHRAALQSYIRRTRPLVLALNTQTAIDSDLIDLRIACHPVRLLADAEAHTHLPQPLITPFSMLPEALRSALTEKDVLDFGLEIQRGRFAFNETHCTTPTSLVVAYALAVATSGQASRVLMAGFDGYAPGDARNEEVESMLECFLRASTDSNLFSITPTQYKGLPTTSLYGM